MISVDIGEGVDYSAKTTIKDGEIISATTKANTKSDTIEEANREDNK